MIHSLRYPTTGLKLWGDQVSFRPPSGFRISVTTDGGHPGIVLPHGNNSPTHYFIGLFSLIWLGGWFAGFSSVVSRLSSGQADAILVFWLVGWTLGGAFAVYLAYRAFRPSMPESLRLLPSGVTYDSGAPPCGSMATHPERIIGNLCFQEGRAWSLIGVNSSRDIAASEIEREWFYRLLATRYSLPLGQRNDGRTRTEQS